MTDFSNPLGIKYRVVQEVTHNDRPARMVSGSAVYETDVEDLWDAITNPERIARWFLPISGDLSLGGRYQLEGNAGGKVTQCDPPDAFQVTWEYGESVTWLRIQLDSIDGGTRLTLEHLMLKDEASEAHWRQFGPGATGVGWDLGFAGLAFHLRTPTPSLLQPYNDWMASEDGKNFIRSCCGEWAVAHVGSGESKEVAEEMADQTAKFYCGE